VTLGWLNSTARYGRRCWTNIFSPKFLHVPLGVGGWPLGYTKSEDVGLIVRAISFQDFQPMWSWSTNVTDEQTDRQTTCDFKTALCTVVHRVVKRVRSSMSGRETLTESGSCCSKKGRREAKQVVSGVKVEGREACNINDDMSALMKSLACHRAYWQARHQSVGYVCGIVLVYRWQENSPLDACNAIANERVSSFLTANQHINSLQLQKVGRRWVQTTIWQKSKKPRASDMQLLQKYNTDFKWSIIFAE